MQLRPYQSELIDDARQALRKYKYVFISLSTGAGKTIIFSAMTTGAFKRQYRVWIIVPRNELLEQASDHLFRHRVPHGVINARSNESRAYLVHLVSKDTLTRRWDKIKNWPDLIIVDEGHLNYKFQMDLKERIPDKTIMIGFSATPERLSGEGLSDIYDTIIYGPSQVDLIELGFLTKIKYFSPPLIGLEDIHRKGIDYNPDELEELFKKRAVYGKAINHYREHGIGKAAMVFCRSVKASEETARQFRNAGYRFESVDGKMAKGRRKAILDGLRTGIIDGICSCELTIYGIDIPRIECIIMLRPTLSRTYFMQMIGRGLRPYPNK
ncbi:MAG TPA: DEAD/DEAH box helicase, partial [bacterium]|nr:DEAD/DEAH box helicase [bacterium]